MAQFPGGTWITLEGRAQKEGVDLVCIGYKYNKKKVLTFVLTRGAGSSEDGEPYHARFPDKFGNLCIRQVARPKVLSTYFKHSNVVDLHNQARQFDLALEKKWITQNGYFRLYTTLLGMTVTDTWKLLKKNDPKYVTVAEFADILANEMIIDAQTQEEQEKADERAKETTSLSEVILTAAVSTVSSVTEASQAMHNTTHTREILKRNQLRCIWCSRVNLVERKTTMRCKECNKGFCRDGSGNGCWSHHVASGGVPSAPKKGTKKRLANEVEDEEDPV